MTSEQQRIAISAACGLTPLVTVPFSPNKVKSGRDGNWFTPEAARWMTKNFKSCARPKVIPDYLNDLNAMHEAVMTLGWVALDTFTMQLRQIIVRDNERKKWPDGRGTPDFFFYNATAAQRAEAFLRTVGKWVD